MSEWSKMGGSYAVPLPGRPFWFKPAHAYFLKKDGDTIADADRVPLGECLCEITEGVHSAELEAQTAPSGRIFYHQPPTVVYVGQVLTAKEQEQLKGYVLNHRDQPPVEGEGYEQRAFRSGIVRLATQVNGNVKAAYEHWLDMTMRIRAFESKGELSADDYKETQLYVQEVAGVGVMCWGGKAWKKSLEQGKSSLKLIQLLAREVGEMLTLQQVADYLEQGTPFLEALKKIMDASPNFLSPPIKEGED